MNKNFLGISIDRLSLDKNRRTDRRQDNNQAQRMNPSYIYEQQQHNIIINRLHLPLKRHGY